MTAQIWDGVSTVTTNTGTFTAAEFLEAMPELRRFGKVLFGLENGVVNMAENFDSARVSLGLGQDASDESVRAAYETWLNASKPIMVTKEASEAAAKEAVDAYTLQLIEEGVLA